MKEHSREIDQNAAPAYCALLKPSSRTGDLSLFMNSRRWQYAAYCAHVARETSSHLTFLELQINHGMYNVVSSCELACRGRES